MKYRWKFARALFPAAFGGMLFTSLGLAADPIVRTYDSPESGRIGSVSFPCDVQLGQRGPLDHVILLDTSASQIGEHRQLGIDVLQKFLASLPAGDRVSVLAYDVNTAPLSATFAAPADAQTEMLTRVKDRIPAGASNLSQALTTAESLLQNSPHGSILIIGDGMSAAHLMQPVELTALTAKLRNQHVPIHAFAVGSCTDLRLLGVLSEETGGYLVRDEWSKQSPDALQVGKLLAQAAHQQVFYPESMSSNAADVEFLPHRPLPMRSDRETVYLFSGNLQAGDKVHFIGQVDQRSVESVSVTPQIERTQGNTFLSHFWKDARATDGVAIGLAGDWMVSAAHQAFEDYVSQVAVTGQISLASGELKQAEQVGTFLKTIDPGNGRADSLLRQARERSVLVAQLPGAPGPGGTAPDDAVPSIPGSAGSTPGAPGTLSSEPPIPAPPSNPLSGRELPVEAGNISSYESLREAKGQKLARQVEMQVQEANRMVDNSLGEQAENLLNRTRTTIKSATDVPADLRNNLLRTVNNTLEQVRARRAQYEAKSQEQQRLRAEAEVSARLIAFARERDLRLVQMVDRIRALMVEASQGEPAAYAAAEAQARSVLDTYPGTAVGIAEVFMTEASTQVDQAARLRSLRSDRFLEVLHQVELSHVPFPDSPPIRYPDAEVWWTLTEMRQKWRSVDLQTSSKNEQKIHEALNKITNVEFPANPLSAVVQYLAEQFGIPILIDRPALEAEGLTGEEEISLVLSGVKLSSALKLMLADVAGTPLTYVVRDEVMMITTEAEADADPTIRVYPVGDLVVPIQPMGGGMMGGMGGGMMGGMGGGMGGGGGFFSIPAQPAASLPSSVSDLKSSPASDLEVVKKKPVR